VFAATSFYWAAGGTAALETLGPRIQELSTERDADFIASVWLTGALKAVAAVLALALVRPFGRSLPRRILLALGWATAALLLVYGAANLVQHALMVTGAVDTPDGLGSTGARWHLWMWDPWWLLGGVLFAAATRSYARSRPVAATAG
jgi:Protein of unknown function (DUF3995)